MTDLAAQLYIDGVYTSFPAYVSEGWSISVGPDADSGPQPNRAEVAFVNDDLSMDPTNPASALFGKIGRNTLARLKIGGVTIGLGEVSSWTPDRTVEHQPGQRRGRAVTPVVIEGLQRRLGRWTDPLRSPMTRQAASYGSAVLGYWPLEDPSTASRFANEVSGGAAATFRGSVSLAGDDGAGGSDKLMTLGTDAVVTGGFVSSTASGYQITWVSKLASAPTSATYLPMFSFRDSLGRTYDWSVNNANFAIEVSASDGTSLDLGVVTYGTLPVAGYVRYRIKVTVSGGTITYEPAWYLQDGSSAVGFTDTFPGTATGQPVSWTIEQNAWTLDAAYGHVLAVKDTSIDLTNGSLIREAFDGFLGERPGARHSRLLGEEGMTGYSLGDGALSPPMGRQKPGRLLDLLIECADTDGGVMYDDPDGLGITLRLSNHLVNQVPRMALTYGVDVSPPFQKVIFDVGTANDIAVSNLDGNTASAVLATGALSVLPPPSGVGRYKKTVDVNVQYTSDLALRAQWELNRGTVDAPRYKSVTLDLLRFPGYKTAAWLLAPGDFITLAGVEADTVTLMVMHFDRRGGAVTDTLTMDCVPAQPWMTGTYDGTSRRYDSRTTTVEALTTTETIWDLTIQDAGDLWSTVAPYDVMVGGERCTVTAMSAASGSGPYAQTATCTRSVNGIVKSHAIGSPVHVFDPARYGL